MKTIVFYDWLDVKNQVTLVLWRTSRTFCVSLDPFFFVCWLIFKKIISNNNIASYKIFEPYSRSKITTRESSRRILKSLFWNNLVFFADINTEVCQHLLKISPTCRIWRPVFRLHRLYPKAVPLKVFVSYNE